MKGVLAALLVCAAFMCSYAQGAKLNFEKDANGDPIIAPCRLTDEYAAWGIVFDPTTQVLEHSVPSDLNSPPNCIFPDQGVDDGLTLDAHFVLPGSPSTNGTVTWVEFFQDRGAQSGGGTFVAYDLSNNVVINEPFNGSGETFRWDYAGGIHRIYIGHCYDGIDDLAFGPVVPEPATLSLLIIGGAALLRRRRQR